MPSIGALGFLLGSATAAVGLGLSEDVVVTYLVGFVIVVLQGIHARRLQMNMEQVRREIRRGETDGENE